ncbi:MAG: FHA domain-containing protein [Anaerolineae bacterium]|nr:FHA domain-containing protein [Anaerolineae bacterium]
MPLDIDAIAAESERPAKDETRVLNQRPAASNVPRWGTASLGSERKLLLHVRGFDTPLVVPLHDRLLLGRYDAPSDSVPDIDLEEYDGTRLGVSRRHAVITVDEDGLRVMDLDSANHTFINGQRLIAHQERILRDGDELRLGQLVMRVNFA